MPPPMPYSSLEESPTSAGLVDMRSMMMGMDGLSLFTCHMRPQTLDDNMKDAWLVVLSSSAAGTAAACASASASGYAGIALRVAS